MLRITIILLGVCHLDALIGIRSYGHQLSQLHTCRAQSSNSKSDSRINVPQSGKKSLTPRPKTKPKFESWTTTKFEEQSSTIPLNPNQDELNLLDTPYEELGEQPGIFKSGFISIIGNPNAGKSTLMNAMLGQNLSIVSPKPQTTRHRILGVLTNTTYQLVFSDTPGMLEPAYKLQEAMMESVRTAAGDADVVCLVSDVYGEPLADNKVMQKLLVTGRPVVVIVNKVDIVSGGGDATWGVVSNGTGMGVPMGAALSMEAAASSVPGTSKPKRRLLLRRTEKVNPVSAPSNLSLSEQYEKEMADARIQAQAQEQESASEGDGNGKKKKPTALSVPQLISLWAQRLPRAKVVCVSAMERWGIDELQELLVSMLPRGPKYFPSDVLTNRDERFFSSEIIRESLLHCYQDELPYSCEVTIDSFQDKAGQTTNGLAVIEATIVASRDSQKAILIGKGGSKLKELGTVARQRLEQFLDRKVFLSLRVKVDEEWRASTEALERYGYMHNEDFG